MQSFLALTEKNIYICKCAYVNPTTMVTQEIKWMKNVELGCLINQLANFLNGACGLMLNLEV